MKSENNDNVSLEEIDSLVMSKKDFTNMVNKEISNLNEESDSLYDRTLYLSDIDVYKRLKDKWNSGFYLVDLIRKKVGALNQIRNYPSYARIQAASDTEINRYRVSKIKKLEEEKESYLKDIEEKNKIIDKYQKKKQELVKKEEDLSIKCVNCDSGKLLDKLLKQGKTIEDDINKIDRDIYSLNYDINILKTIVISIDEKIIELSYKSNPEIRDMICSRLKNSEELKEEIDWVLENPIHQDKTAMMLINGTTSEKAHKLPELMTIYYELSDKLKNLKCEVEVKNNLPTALEKQLHGKCNCNLKARRDSYLSTSDYAIERLQINDDVLKIILEFNAEYKKLKEEITNEYTQEKLGGLVGDIFEAQEEFDIDFLELHRNKFTPEEKQELDELKKYVLFNKTITQKAKRQYQKLFFSIKKWYLTKNMEILDIYGLSLNPINKEELDKSLDIIFRRLDKIGNKLDNLNASIAEAQKEYNNLKLVLQIERYEISDEIREICGNTDASVELPQVKDINDENSKIISDYVQKLAVTDMIDKVNQQAEIQASIKAKRLMEEQSNKSYVKKK